MCSKLCSLLEAKLNCSSSIHSIVPTLTHCSPHKHICIHLYAQDSIMKFIFRLPFGIENMIRDQNRVLVSNVMWSTGLADKHREMATICDCCAWTILFRCDNRDSLLNTFYMRLYIMQNATLCHLSGNQDWQRWSPLLSDLIIGYSQNVAVVNEVIEHFLFLYTYVRMCVCTCVCVCVCSF